MDSDYSSLTLLLSIFLSMPLVEANGPSVDNQSPSTSKGCSLSQGVIRYILTNVIGGGNRITCRQPVTFRK